MLTSAARQRAVLWEYIEEGEGVCLLVCLCVCTEVHFSHHIFCRINTSLLLPITLLFACLNTAGFIHIVFPLCALHYQLRHTLFNKVNTEKVTLS